MTKLKRSLGFTAAYAASTGLVVSGTAMVSLGNGFGTGGLAFAIPAFIGLVIILMVAISYGELASMLPGGGMVGEYTMPALGRLMAIIAVLGGYMVLVSADGGTQLMVAGNAFQSLTGVPAPAFSFLLLAILFALNIAGVNFYARVQIPIVVTKMSILAIMGFCGIFGFGTGTPVDNPFLATDWGTLASMGAVAIWLYIGMEFVAPLAEEIKNPWKNIPLAMVAGVITIFIVDLLFGWGATRYADLAEMASSSIPQVVGATAIFGGAGGLIMTLGTIAASFSTGNSYLAAIPRMLYGLANEGLLPKWFGKVSRRTRVPWAGMIVTAACMASVLAYSMFSSGGIDLILTLVSIACTTWLLSYISAQVDVIVLRRKYPNAKRPFKTPFYPLPQVLGIASCVYLIVFIVPDFDQRIVIWSVAGILIAAIALFGIVWLKANRLPLFTPTDLTHTQSNIIVRSESMNDENDDATGPAEDPADAEPEGAETAMSGFGGRISVAPVQGRRQRKHPLAGEGPIVDRARRALRFTAEQFGTVRRADRTTVEVRTDDGIDLVLSYDPGNFIFSRVYALTVSTRLPESALAPSGVKLSHRGTPRGGAFIPDRGAAAQPSQGLDRLNAAASPHLARIDLVHARISGSARRTLTLSPMGGAFVWVLIPPVFKATAFPPGEPARILDLIRAVRALTPAASQSPSPAA